MIAAQTEAGRNRRILSMEAGRAAGSAREPELMAIARGLIRAGESQPPIREMCRIVRHLCGVWGFIRGFWVLGGGTSSDRLKVMQDGTSRQPSQYQPIPRGGGRRQHEKGNTGPRQGAGQGPAATGEAVDTNHDGNRRGSGHESRRGSPIAM